MKVLYDYQAFAMQAFGGVSRSFVQLISHLPDTIQYEIAIKKCINEHLHESGIAPEVKRQQYPLAGLSRRGWGNKAFKAYNHFFERMPGQRVSVNALQRKDFDVFHPTFFNTYFLKYLNNKPFVLTVHDLTYEVLSDIVKPHRNDDQVTQRSILCPLASRIIAVSENTAADIMKFYHVPESKIKVIYHGAPETHESRSLKPLFDFPYLLYVGSRGSYKNFTWMLDALQPWLQQQGNVKLVCTGPEFNASELEQIHSLGLTDMVVHRFADSDELYRLYNHAEVFIYPSMYEGFGIPILEAFANGCPVILSRASCFPEIAGDAALYFDLNDRSSLLKQVESITRDKQVRTSLLEKGQQRLQQFSWEKSAQELAQLYLSL